MMKLISGLIVELCLLQIREKLLQLMDKKQEMMTKWDDRWDWLRLCESDLLPSPSLHLPPPVHPSLHPLLSLALSVHPSIPR